MTWKEASGLRRRRHRSRPVVEGPRIRRNCAPIPPQNNKKMTKKKPPNFVEISPTRSAASSDREYKKKRFFQMIFSLGKLNFRSDACWGGAWGEWCAFPRLLLVGARHINISSIDQRPFSDIAMTFCHGFLLARVDIITNSVPGGLFFFRRFFFGFRRSVVHNEQSPLRESLCGSSTVTFVC